MTVAIVNAAGGEEATLVRDLPVERYKQVSLCWNGQRGAAPAWRSGAAGRISPAGEPARPEPPGVLPRRLRAAGGTAMSFLTLATAHGLGEAAEKLGVIAVALLVAVVVLGGPERLPRVSQRARALALLAVLVLTPVLLAIDIWHTTQFEHLRAHPAEAAGAVVLGLAVVLGAGAAGVPAPAGVRGAGGGGAAVPAADLDGRERLEPAGAAVPGGGRGGAGVSRAAAARRPLASVRAGWGGANSQPPCARRASPDVRRRRRRLRARGRGWRGR